MNIKYIIFCNQTSMGCLDCLMGRMRTSCSRPAQRRRTRRTRLDELFEGSDGWEQRLGAFEIYLEECLDFPFRARFKSKEYGDTRRVFNVLRIAYTKNKGGVFCEIAQNAGPHREVPVYYIKPVDQQHRRNTAINDYISWLPFKT